VDTWADENVDEAWAANRQQTMSVLQREAELEELVRLVGLESLSASDRLLMEAARMIREDFLHQSAFDDVDTYSSLKKQFRLLRAILFFYKLAEEALGRGAELDEILGVPAVEAISRAKRIPEDQADRFDAIEGQVKEELGAIGAPEQTAPAEEKGSV
jgi:V/A-type H+-transporting ATPase subunit A